MIGIQQQFRPFSEKIGGQALGQYVQKYQFVYKFESLPYYSHSDKPNHHMLKVIHPVHVMVTPRVREEARKHFGCERLEGAELENQGGDGTALTHWEKRLFEVRPKLKKYKCTYLLNPCTISFQLCRMRQ